MVMSAWQGPGGVIGIDYKRHQAIRFALTDGLGGSWWGDR